MVIEDMELKYRLLDNSVGVIITRQPIIIKDKLSVSFLDAPPNATAIFENEHGATFYRELIDKNCSIDLSKIIGRVRVTVAILNDLKTCLRWACEDFVLSNLENGEVLVCPNDMDLPQKVTTLMIENAEIRRANMLLNEKLRELDAKFARIMEGYDLT